MTQELSKDLANDLTRQFEAALASVRYEFKKTSKRSTPLTGTRLKRDWTYSINDLSSFSTQVMEYLSKVRGGVNPQTHKFVVEAPPLSRIEEVAASIIAGGGAAILVALIPVGTTGLWLWATTITAAASIGSAVGATVGVVTAGIGVLVGAAVGVCVSFGMRKPRRKLIRKKLLSMFDEKITPQLRAWVESKIQTT